MQRAKERVCTFAFFPPRGREPIEYSGNLTSILQRISLAVSVCVCVCVCAKEEITKIKHTHKKEEIKS